MNPGQDRLVSHTDAEWNALDPILKAGEIGINRNGGRFKYGDGVSHWSQLRYLDEDFATKAAVSTDIATLNAAIVSVSTVATSAGGDAKGVKQQIDAVNAQLAAIQAHLQTIDAQIVQLQNSVIASTVPPT